MSTTASVIKCPKCGASLSIEDKVCSFCDSPVLITSLNNIYTMPLVDVNKYVSSYNESSIKNGPINNSIGMCYLKLKMYDKAIEAFDTAISQNLNSSDTYFWAAVTMLGGKKAFVAPRDTINKIIEYLNAATLIETKGIYYFFLAYVKQDFFARKYLRTTPDYKECLNMAKQYGVSELDIKILFDVLGVDIPKELLNA